MALSSFYSLVLRVAWFWFLMNEDLSEKRQCLCLSRIISLRLYFLPPRPPHIRPTMVGETEEESCCDDDKDSSSSDDAETPLPQQVSLDKRANGADAPLALASWSRIQASLLTQNRDSSVPLRQVRKDLETLKTTVRQLQQEHSHDTASSSQIDESILSLKGQMMTLQRDLSSCATRKQLKQAEESIQRLKANTERIVTDSQAAFRTDIDDCIEGKLGEIQGWFKELEALTKQRQATLDARMASVAMSGDLVVLQSTVERESAEMNERLDTIGHTADTVAVALSHIRFNMALAALTRLHRSATLRLLRRAWKSWIVWLKESNEARKRFLLQSRLTRKVLTRIMLRRKHIGFARWVEYVESQRKAEARKRAAIDLLQQKISSSMNQPIQRAFVHWRRFVLIDKICVAEASAVPSPTASSSVPTTPVPDFDRSNLQDAGGLSDDYSSQSDLSLVLDRLKNDAHGSAQALAQEICNLRKRDIGQLRLDFSKEKAVQKERIDEAAKSLQDQLTTCQDRFEGRVQGTVQKISKEIPTIQSKVDDLQSSHTVHAEKTSAAEKHHAQQLDVLSERNDLLAERLGQLESRLTRADEHVRSLEEDKAKSNEVIDSLLRRLKTSEQRHDGADSKLQSIVRRFAEENTELRQRLEIVENDNRTLLEGLQSTQATLDKHRARTQHSLDGIRAVLDTHGICKPKLVKMIQLCVLYEKTAKEKNYVVSIDTVFDGNDPADLPCNIAAFAHDYALWIAYQADHEVLQRAIARSQSNHHDLAYADDDLGPRRLELLEGLKSDLCLALEAVHPDAGLLKLEARSRFINRLMEATDSALSKHDQIVIETTSRIGKLRSSSKSVPVCVACDRPLRSRRRANGDGGGAGDQEARHGRDLSSEPASGNTVDGTAELIVGSATSRAVVMDVETPKRSNQRSDHHSSHVEGKTYTMRCGFRMPLVDNSDSCGPSSPAREMRGAEGEQESAESENAEPNTTGAGKPKAVLRQMSLP